MNRQRKIAVVWSVLLLAAPGAAHCHEFKLDAVVNAFVKIEPTEAHVLVRAPLYLFKSAKFPIKGAEIDSDNSAAATDRALIGLQQGLAIFEDGHALLARSATGRLALPSDRSFESYELAASHVATAIEADTHIVVDQGFVDAHLIYPITSANSVFSLRTSIAPELGDYLKFAVRYLPQNGDGRAMMIRSRSGTVDLNPTWFGAAVGFVGLGIVHILTGIDHLLFLLCLIIPLRGWRQLLTVISSFTLAHSFTLIGSAFGLAPQGPWFPPLVEMVIALSIVYTALENIVGVDLRRRVLLTLLFGLMHGFGFSYGLQEDLQFAGSHLLVSLFTFNIGIEIGQLMVLAVMLPAIAWVTRHVLPGRAGSIILAALLAHAGWHWMADRWDALAQARWPTLDRSDLPLLLFWAAGLVLAAGGTIAAVRRLRLDPATLSRNSEEPAARSLPNA